MGKKSQSKAAVVTSQERLRHASNKLERYIYQAQHHTITTILEEALPNISFTTYERGKDLLRETRKEATKPRKIRHSSEEDSEEQRREVRKKERVADEFQERLEKSLPSYEHTSQIFRNVPLKQKYRHLLKNEEEEQQQKTQRAVEELREEEEAALGKIKQLYRRYRVSNMYKLSVVNKICLKYVEELIKKGFIRQHNTILSLIC